MHAALPVNSRTVAYITVDRRKRIHYKASANFCDGSVMVIDRRVANLVRHAQDYVIKKRFYSSSLEEKKAFKLAISRKCSTLFKRFNKRN